MISSCVTDAVQHFCLEMGGPAQSVTLLTQI